MNFGLAFLHPEHAVAQPARLLAVPLAAADHLARYEAFDLVHLQQGLDELAGGLARLVDPLVQEPNVQGEERDADTDFRLAVRVPCGRK